MKIPVSPLMSVMNQTIAFFINKKVWGYLFPVPVIICAVLAGIEMYSPFVVPANRIELVYVLNWPVILLFLLVYSFVLITAMVAVMRKIFFDDRWNGVFIPVPKRSDWLFLLTLIQIAVVSLCLSYGVLWVLLFILTRFFEFPTYPISVFLLAGLVIFPYFMIRQCMRLPASVANDYLGLFKGWHMTQESGLMLCFYYLMSALFPILLVLLIATLVPFGLFVSNLLALIGGVFSSMIQSALMAYLYVYLKEREN